MSSQNKPPQYPAVRTQKEVAALMGLNWWQVAEAEKSALRKLRRALSQGSTR